MAETGKLYIGGDAVKYGYLGNQCVYELLIEGGGEGSITFEFLNQSLADTIYVYETTGTQQTLSALTVAPYVFTGNVGDRIGWSCVHRSGNNAYKASGTLTILGNRTQYIDMVQYFKVTGTVSPAAANGYISFHATNINDEWQDSSYQRFKSGATVDWYAYPTATGYSSQNGSFVISADTTINAVLPAITYSYTVTFRMKPKLLADVPMRITNQSTGTYQDLTGSVSGDYVVYTATLEQGTTWDYEPIGEENYGYYGAALDVGPITGNTTAETINCVHVPYHVTIVPTPSDATVVLNGEVRTTMTAYSGDSITATVSRQDYNTVTTAFTIFGLYTEYTIPVQLTYTGVVSYNVSISLSPFVSTSQLLYVRKNNDSSTDTTITGTRNSDVMIYNYTVNAGDTLTYWVPNTMGYQLAQQTKTNIQSSISTAHSLTHVQYTVNINPTPSTAGVIMNNSARKTMTGYSGTVINYTVSATNYTTQTGSFTISGTNTTVNHDVVLQPSAPTQASITFVIREWGSADGLAGAYLYINGAYYDRTLTSSFPEIVYTGYIGDTISYRVTHSEHLDYEGTLTITGNTTVNVFMDPIPPTTYTANFYVWPTGAEISPSPTFSLTGATLVNKGIITRSSVPDSNYDSDWYQCSAVSGTVLSWSLNGSSIQSQSESLTLDSNKDIDIINKVHYSVTSRTPSDATVELNNVARTSVDVNWGSSVKYNIYKTGYISQSGYTAALERNTNTAFTLVSLSGQVTFNVTPSNALIYYDILSSPSATPSLTPLDGNTLMVEKGKYLYYQVSYIYYADEVATVQITGDTALNITMKPMYSISFATIPTPSDRTIQISSGGSFVTLAGTTCSAKSGSEITYKIMANYYDTIQDTFTLSGETFISKGMVGQYFFDVSAATTPSYGITTNPNNSVTYVNKTTLSDGRTRFSFKYDASKANGASAVFSFTDGTNTETYSLGTNEWYTHFIDITLGGTVDYSKEYFTLEVVSPGTIGFRANTTAITKTIQYSVNNGAWTSITSSTDANGASLGTFAAGDKIRLKGENNRYASGSSRHNRFIGTATFNAYGNIASLVNGDSFTGTTPTLGASGFSYMFSGCSIIISAENMIIPFNIPSYGCYYMFYGCHNLTKAPQLLGTSIGTAGCNCMFYDCSKLTTPSQFSGTSVAASGCQRMFYNCTALTKSMNASEITTVGGAAFYGTYQLCTSLTECSIPKATTVQASACCQMYMGCTSLVHGPANLPATTLNTACYADMFSGCTGMTTAPALPATTLKASCYYKMFANTKITTAPTLTATTLPTYCYYGMFSACTALTSVIGGVPANSVGTYCCNHMFRGCSSLNYMTNVENSLKATSLANSCYAYMFHGCSNFNMAPTLPATSLTANCYSNMFYGCSSLNRLTALFTTTPSTSYTSNWLYGVASTGTFTANSNATWPNSITKGASTVPTGWSIVQ